jgi:hypothetical protein
MAILLTASVAFGIFASSYDIIGILVAVGLWMAYTNAKSPDPRMSPTGLKIVSGSIKASVIVLHVFAGLMALLGILCIVAGSYIVSFAEDLVTFSVSGSLGDMDGLTYLLGKAAGNAVFAVLAIMMFVIAAGIEAVNIFFVRNAHKLSKSICVSAETGIMNIAKSSTVRIWLLVLGIINCVGTVGNIAAGSEFVSVVSSACGAALFIVGSVWISKQIEIPTPLPVMQNVQEQESVAAISEHTEDDNKPEDK